MRRWRYTPAEIIRLAERRLAGQSTFRIALEIGACPNHLDAILRPLIPSRYRHRYTPEFVNDLARRRMSGQSLRSMAREIGACRCHLRRVLRKSQAVTDILVIHRQNPGANQRGTL